MGKKLLLCLVLVTAFVAISYPTKSHAVEVPNVNYKYCPTIKAGEFDGWIFTNPALKVYEGSKAEGTPLYTVEMNGPDKSGTAGVTPCYFNFTGTDSYNTELLGKNITLQMFLMVSPPGSKAGDLITRSVTVTKAIKGPLLESGDTLQFDAEIKESMIKNTSSRGDDNFSLNIYRKCENVPDSEALTCWVEATYKFSQKALFILSLGAVIAAGLIYMTSMGDPNRITLAKKILFGAASAIIIIVLGRFFLTKVVGVPWPL